MMLLLLFAMMLSTHSLDPCLWGESDHPAFGPPANLSLVCVGVTEGA